MENNVNVDKYVDIDSDQFSDKGVFITGSTSGIGRKAAIGFAKRGADVYIHGRDRDAGQELKQELRTEFGSDADFFQADFSDLDEVRHITDQLGDRSVDILVNNAGAFIREDMSALSGLQYTFVVNHLSHFVLTSRILAGSSGTVRVVNTASEAHRGAESLTIPGDIQTEDNGWDAYCRSKAINVMFTYLLRSKFSDRVEAVSIHPGAIPGSGFLRSLPGPISRIGNVAEYIPIPGVDTTNKGASMILYAAVVTPSQSAYFSDFSPKEPTDLTRNEQKQDDLWQFSKETSEISEFGTPP